MRVDPERKIIQSSCQYLFTLLGSTGVKAVCRKLMKLTPELNFINILLTAFTRIDPKRVKKTVKLSIFFMLLGSTSLKAARKMLVTLTPGVDFTNVL